MISDVDYQFWAASGGKRYNSCLIDAKYVLKSTIIAKISAGGGPKMTQINSRMYRIIRISLSRGSNQKGGSNQWNSTDTPLRAFSTQKEGGTLDFRDRTRNVGEFEPFPDLYKPPSSKISRRFGAISPSIGT